ncbi:MAG TPA: ArsR family transcriptional regulator [Pseudomonadales bacterium]|nr:ArsR family transcriptional regulator [Pseudomonadales bacterium]
MASKDKNSTSQDKILYQIKRLGPRTARDLAALLEVTTMGIRQHLAQLETEGLVEALPEEARGRGRPARRWKLTHAGHQRFPDAHAQVTHDIIVSVRELLGEHAMEKVIERRTEETLAHYRSEMAAASTLEEKVGKLCELRSQEGYMAECRAHDDSSWLLIEHHCPICIAARACQGFCSSELDVFAALFEGVAQVTREDHLLHGGRRCTYRIAPQGA